MEIKEVEIKEVKIKEVEKEDDILSQERQANPGKLQVNY